MKTMVTQLTLLSLIASYSVEAGKNRLQGKITISSSLVDGSSLCDQVIVFLEPEDPIEIPTKKIAPANMGSKDKSFQPGILVVQKGSEVHFPNEDTILHNVFSLSKAKNFDLGLYRKDTKGKKVTFDQTGLVKVYCNIHASMTGIILVLDNPWYSRVGKDCRYQIEGIPDGKYTISAWFRYGKGKELKVSIPQQKDVNFTLKQTKNLQAKHKNKFGKSYKENY